MLELQGIQAPLAQALVWKRPSAVLPLGHDCSTSASHQTLRMREKLAVTTTTS